MSTYGSSYLVAFLLWTYTLFRILYVCGLWLLSLIVSPSTINGVFNIMSSQKNIWPSVACRLIWYVNCTSKAVVANIPDQGSSSSRWLFCNSNVLARFSVTWWVLYNIGFTCGFSVVSHLALIPNLFKIRSLWMHDQGIHSRDQTSFSQALLLYITTFILLSLIL